MYIARWIYFENKNQEHLYVIQNCICDKFTSFAIKKLLDIQVCKFDKH